MSYPPLPPEPALLWGQASAAIAAGELPRAQVSATLAVATSGWNAYFIPTVVCGVHIGICEFLPSHWVYYEDTGRWDQLILIHPDATDFMVWSSGLGEMMRVLYEAGQGLIELDRLLAAAALADLSPGVERE